MTLLPMMIYCVIDDSDFIGKVAHCARLRKEEFLYGREILLREVMTVRSLTLLCVVLLLVGS